MKTIATITNAITTNATTAKNTVIEAIKNSSEISDEFKGEKIAAFLNGEIISDQLWEKYSYGAEYFYKATPTGLAAWGWSCGGNDFRIEFDGDKITVEHFGRRGGFPGNMLQLLPDELKDSTLWTLEVYETSEPSWAPINAFLTGSFGSTGFTSQYEKDQSELADLCGKIKELANVIGRKIDCQDMPCHLCDAEIMYKNMLNTCHGVEYRRLKASGF